MHQETTMKHVAVRVLLVIALVTAAVAMASIASTQADVGAAQGKAQPFSMMTPF
ncbi:MAG: hypothetical protein L0H23_04560 [Luteimonas sp.]|nr:hypothetical protein [Luteimonas sp.]